MKNTMALAAERAGALGVLMTAQVPAPPRPPVSTIYCQQGWKPATTKPPAAKPRSAKPQGAKPKG